jgi:hypothetical protein
MEYLGVDGNNDNEGESFAADSSCSSICLFDENEEGEEESLSCSDTGSNKEHFKFEIGMKFDSLVHF